MNRVFLVLIALIFTAAAHAAPLKRADRALAKIGGVEAAELLAFQQDPEGRTAPDPTKRCQGAAGLFSCGFLAVPIVGGPNMQPSIAVPDGGRDDRVPAGQIVAVPLGPPKIAA